MTLMRVAVAHGYVLTYDTEDVENIEISAPADIRSGPSPDGRSMHRELTGDFHLDLHIDFKHGRKALWVKEEDLAPITDEALGALMEPEPPKGDDDD